MSINLPTNALSFNTSGSSGTDFVQISHDASISPDSWTVEAWISTDDSDAQFNRIVRKPVGGQQTYSLLVKDGQAQVRFDPGSELQAGPNIADGELHHLVGVFDNAANQLILYVDGQEVGRSNASGTPVQGTESLFLGNVPTVANQSFSGVIDEVRVWDRPLSHLEILKNADSVDFAAEANLQLRWTSDDGNSNLQTKQPAITETLNGVPEDATVFRLTPGDSEPLAGVSINPIAPNDVVVVITLSSGLGTLSVDASIPNVIIGGNGTAEIEIRGADVNAALATLEVTVDAGASGAHTIRIQELLDGDVVDQRLIAINVALPPEAESLEVTTLLDIIDPLDGLTSIREALEFANRVDDALGDGLPDTITFADDLQGGTVQFDTLDSLTITDDLTISGDIFLRAPFVASGGSVVEVTGGTVTLEGLTISNSSAGLIVAAGADVTLRNVEVSGNFFESVTGGGIRSEGNLTILDSEISGNTTGASGGGIHQSGGTLKIHDSIISDNRISNAGLNAVFGAAGITLADGAIAEISNSLIEDNRATNLSTGGRAGGLLLEANSQAVIVNTTFHNNSFELNPLLSDGAGSIFNENGFLELVHSTVTGGVGSFTGGLRTVGGGLDGSTTLRNSIITGNRDQDGSANDLSQNGALILTGKNIIGDSLFDGVTAIQNNILTSDVFAVVDGLGAGVLASNGGPVETVLLKADGVAVDPGGTPATQDELDADRDGDTAEDLDVDARGGDRLVGSSRDLGAVEISVPTQGDDIVFSTLLNRTAIGLGGDDTLEGSTERDRLEGGLGDDTLIGASGEDLLEGGGDSDRLYGGSGQDSLLGDAGDDTLEGGAGADDLDGGSGMHDAVSYQGSSGAVSVDLTANTVSGGDAEGDTITGFEVVIGSALGDNITGRTVQDTLFGGDGDDVLIGETGADSLSGDAGDDSLFGGFAADSLDGGDGDDLLSGGFGDDEIDGGAGIDTGDYSEFGGAVNINLSLTSAQDTNAGGIETISNIENLIGGIGNDRFTGTTDVNGLSGASGSDQLFGLGGADSLFGEDGNDTLLGGAGDDDLFGGLGRDILLGGADNDNLFGGDANDQLRGGAGSDLLEGGLGRDVLIGGDFVSGTGFPGDGAADTFRINSVDESPAVAASRDIIRDFEQGLDTIDLSNIDANPDNPDIDSGFTFIGDADFSGAIGELRAFTVGNTIIRGDINGDGNADLEIFVNGIIVFQESDFIL